MKKRTLLGCLILATLSAYAQTEKKDSMQIIGLQEIEVLSVRATETNPIAFTDINEKQLSKYNSGVDFPYLISMTPSAITTSDAGAGIGYTTLRVRGTDATRINVTANGFPVNDAESHSVFWVNMPDLASSVKDVQIQRGVGTSTNGAGSFGASINMNTAKSSMQPYAELNASYGSFNTHKETLKVGTGLIKEHWAFDARVSNIQSDGYIDRATAKMNSYYLQGAFYSDNTSIRLLTFGGKENTYHAWNYASKEQMEAFGRKFNSCGYIGITMPDGSFQQADIDYDIEGTKELLNKGGKFKFYDEQTDNYAQHNYQLLIDHHFKNNISANIGLHYTKGAGYYQEYKSNRKLKEYNLSTFDIAGQEVKKSDLIRRKAMDNDFGGAIFSVNYKNSKINTTLGGAFNHYNGDHFGNVLWVKNYIGNLDPNHEYYRNKGRKNDSNIYIKADYSPISSLNIYADLQYRHIDYRIDGKNDKWNSVTDDGLQTLNVNEKFDFFNPKAGISWQINRMNRLFASFSVANKEPTRNNYTDGKLTEHPRPEQLLDYELGYTFKNSWVHAGANLYYMDYKDQLVLTGELNEIGEPMATNVPESYRAGIEAIAGIQLECGFSWDINATFSRNRIKNFTEVLYDDNTYEEWRIEHKETPIAFSPDIIANSILGYKFYGAEISLHSQYVSKQYMSNANQEEHTLDAYFVNNLYASYTFKLKSIESITVGLNVYNLFNEKYENNGYAGSGYYTEDGIKKRYNYAGYAAQAGTNFLGHISIKL